MTEEILGLLDTFRKRGGSIYIVEYSDGKVFIYRELTLGEWNSLTSMNLTELSALEHMIKLGLLYPKPEALLPGEIKKIGELIYQVSSKFADDEAMANTIREKKQRILSGASGLDSIVLSICEAFPAYKPEDVYNFDFETLTTRLAQSEAKFAPKREPAVLSPARKAQGNMTVSDLQQQSIDASTAALQAKLNKRRSN